MAEHGETKDVTLWLGRLGAALTIASSASFLVALVYLAATPWLDSAPSLRISPPSSSGTFTLVAGVICLALSPDALEARWRRLLLSVACGVAGALALFSLLAGGNLLFDVLTHNGGLPVSSALSFAVAGLAALIVAGIDAAVAVFSFLLFRKSRLESPSVGEETLPYSSRPAVGALAVFVVLFGVALAVNQAGADHYQQNVNNQSVQSLFGNQPGANPSGAFFNLGTAPPSETPNGSYPTPLP